MTIAAIAALNDLARRAPGVTCRVFDSPGIAALTAEERAEIRDKIAAVDASGRADDACGFRDLGVVEVDGRCVEWRIDAFDPLMQALSDQPADPAKSQRVLSISLVGEW